MTSTHLPPEIIYNILSYIVPLLPLDLSIGKPDEASIAPPSYLERQRSLANASLIAREWTAPAQAVMFEQVLVEGEGQMRNLLDHGLLERFTIISLGLREYAPKATDLAASLETVHAVLERARGVKRLELKSLWQVDPMVLVSEGLKGVEHFDMNKSCFALPDPSSSPPTLHWPLQTFDLAPHHTNPPNLPPLILTSLHSLRYKSTYSTDPPSLPTLLSSLLPLVGPSLQTLTLDYYHPQTPLAFTPHISSLSSLKNLIFISKHFTPHSLSRFLEALIPPQTRLKTLKINLSASQVPMFLHSLKSLEALRELKLLQVGLESLALANVEERLPPSAIALRRWAYSSQREWKLLRSECETRRIELLLLDRW